MYQNKKYSEETKKYFKIIKVEDFLKKVKKISEAFTGKKHSKERIQ